MLYFLDKFVNKFIVYCILNIDDLILDFNVNFLNNVLDVILILFV